MATVALYGQGVLLQVAIRGDTSPYDFQTIADVDSIDGPTGVATPLDVTSHSSPSGSKEFISGPRDYGSMEFGIFFNPSNLTHKYFDGIGASPDDQDGILYMFVNGATYHWRVQFPQTSPDTQWELDGFVEKFH